VTDDLPQYEVYHGLGGRTPAVLVTCVGFLIVALVAPMPLGFRIGFFLFFGGIGALFLVNGLSHRVALRADARGVTLGGTMLRYQATTTFVPWDDIERVVLWQRRMRRSSPMPYLALVGKWGSPQPPETTARMLARAEALGAPSIPGRILAISAVTSWHLDVARLATVAAVYNPNISIVTGAGWACTSTRRGKSSTNTEPQ
jgi:hypothetical protein